MGRSDKRETFDHERLQLNIARIKKQGQTFEIVVDPDLAIEFKHGKKEVDINDVLKSPQVFADAKKGMVSSDAEMNQTFGSADSLEVAKKIIKDGEIQLTKEHRDRIRDDKQKRILSIIQRNGVDPKTHLPHPLPRIESAFEQSKVKIDEFKPADSQVQDILKAMRVILPIKFEIKEVEVKIPAEYAAKSYSTLKNFGTLLKEEWLNDGSLLAVIEIPGGIEADLYEKMNSLCHGALETKVINTR